MNERPLVVQLWGIGNLVQTEPLMRYLGGGDILVDPRRSTHELAPLFAGSREAGPDWTFRRTDEFPADYGEYTDAYICGPWLPSFQLAQVADRTHVPTWTHRGEWGVTEAQALVNMLDPKGDPAIPRLPRLDGFPAPNSDPCIVVSCGYNRHEGDAWAFKDWGERNFRELFDQLARREIRVNLVGTEEEFGLMKQWMGGSGCNYRYQMQFMEAVRWSSACVGYIGNDTGWAHICGAYGIPSAIYVADPNRQDPVKNRTAAPVLWQFGPDSSPEKVVDWLLREIG
jgi:hypothetical protein